MFYWLCWAGLGKPGRLVLGSSIVIVSFSIRIGCGLRVFVCVCCFYVSISRGGNDFSNDDSRDVNMTEEENAELEEKAEFADDDSSSWWSRIGVDLASGCCYEISELKTDVFIDDSSSFSLSTFSFLWT